MEQAEVSKLTLTDVTVQTQDPEVAAALAAVFPGRKNVFPLVQQELSFEISKVNSAVACAFQRTMTEELPGKYLNFDLDDVRPESNDPFMLPEFIQLGIRNLPLRYGAETQTPPIEFHIDARNDSAEVRTIYAGDLKTTRGGKPYQLSAPLFNPSHEIGFLQPGKMLLVQNIHMVESTGRIFCGAAVAVRGRMVPLDLEQIPREQTHVGFRGNAKKSGYVLSSQIATPSRFRVSVTIPAALRGSQAARKLPVEACNNILRRLRLVRGVVDRAMDAERHSEHVESDASYWIVQSAADPSTDNRVTGILHLRGETSTIVQMLKVDLGLSAPDISFVGSDKKIESNAIQLTLMLRGGVEDLSTHLKQTIERCVSLFTRLRGRFEAA